MTRFCDAVHRAVGWALVALVGVMTLTVGWQVVSRLLARLSLEMGWPLLVEPSRWTEELAGFQLAWVALLGAAYALRRGDHPGLDVLHRWLDPSVRRAAEVAGFSLIAFFSLAVVGFGGLQLVLMTHELDQRTAALGWPMASIYSVMPVAGALLALFSVEALLRSLRGESR